MTTQETRKLMNRVEQGLAIVNQIMNDYKSNKHSVLSDIEQAQKCLMSAKNRIKLPESENK